MMKFVTFFKKFYLPALGLSCGMRDPVPQPGTEPRPPALGAEILSHWTTKEVLKFVTLSDKEERRRHLFISSI